MNPNDFLDTALSAARAAKASILTHYQQNLQVEIKADRTPVTQADRAAEDIIREILLGRFPEHGLYGEERGRAFKYAEAFEICEYGRQPNNEELRKLFPFFD